MSSCHSQLTVHSCTRHRRACTSHQHSLPGMAPGRGPGGPRSLQRAWLFQAIVSLLPGGHVALSSAPVSHDSQRNSTHTTMVGWAAVSRLCLHGAVPTHVRILVTLTTTGGTAALGVLQQLGGAAGPRGVPLLQPQPGRLILGEGAQVLRVTPIHLGEKE